MPTTTLPVISREPILEVVKPEIGPWNDRLVYPLCWLPLPSAGKIETESQRILVDMRQGPLAREDQQIRFDDPNGWRLAGSVRDVRTVGPRQRCRLNCYLPDQALEVHGTRTANGQVRSQKQQLLRERQSFPTTPPYHWSPKNVFAATAVDAAAFEVVSPIRGATESKPDLRPSETAPTRRPMTRPVTPAPKERSMFRDTRS